VPCDSPFLPADLVERLYKRLDETGAELAVAKTGDQPHPVFSLMRRGVLDHLGVEHTLTERWSGADA
jgi:molybdopterin-guanine dinucleotide biosynthesis protein A